jgi:hypothetical protein
MSYRPGSLQLQTGRGSGPYTGRHQQRHRACECAPQIRSEMQSPRSKMNLESAPSDGLKTVTLFHCTTRIHIFLESGPNEER